MRAGYESPTFSDKVVQNFETGVSAPANVNYKWSPSDSKDSHLWQDVEFNRYNQKLMDQVLFNESYCVNDFKNDYNSYKGNAYGLANTLFQTAFLRPKLKR